jgi:hypothetical protein
LQTVERSGIVKTEKSARKDTHMAEQPEDPLAQAAKVLLDVVYVAVGFGLLTFQKLQVARREFEAELKRRV